MIPVIGSLVMGLCSGALFWATASIGRRSVPVPAAVGAPRAAAPADSAAATGLGKS